jgi:GT2 family glycosyltransferase
LIAALRRLFRRGREPGKSLAAPLSDVLVLVADAGRSRGASAWRSSTRLDGVRFAIGNVAEQAEARKLPAVGLAELLDRVVPRLGRRARSDLFDFVLAAVLSDLEKPGAPMLADNLRLLRDRLRETLPALGGDPRAAPLFVVDTIAAVDERSFWITGWYSDEDGTLDRLEAVSPEGQRAPLLDGAYRFTRPDVQDMLISSISKQGFARYTELSAPSPLNEGWICELRSPAGGGFQAAVPAVGRDSRAAQKQITETAMDEHDVDAMRRLQGHPALQRLPARVAASTRVENAIQYGEPPESPEVSILVPLYRRIDFIEHQIVQFWEDPEIASSELIYVLDSPELAEPLTRLAAGLHELYELPFKVVTLNRNAGYSTANNVGASLARGRLLVLLNSDVLPDEPGWLGRMSGFYDATPEIGALGPKLLYEDDSIQHAGMHFQRDAATGYWENQHYFKGFSRALAAANVSRPVPAVTGACLMLERALWNELGGLRDAYVQGGYEDSDLCLRLLDAGRRNWYLASAELYHLEAQSFQIAARGANRYNAWLQTHLWDARIEEVMRAQQEQTAQVIAVQ